MIRLNISPSLWNALLCFFSYSMWTWAFRLLALTCVTFFLRSTHTNLQEISDIYGSIELIIYGFSAFFFVLLLRFLNPITTTSISEIFSPDCLEKKFFPGLFQGALLGLCFVFGLMLKGDYRSLGNPNAWEEYPWTLFNAALRALSIVGFIYFEEFIFRHKILKSLRRDFGNVVSIVGTAFLYCTLKTFQFNLAWMTLLTLFIFSIGAGVRTVFEEDFTQSAGFFAGLLLVFHPLLSLPIFGSEFQGLVLLRDSFSGLRESTYGPLSSLILQLILSLLGIKMIYKHKKTLLSLLSKR